MKENTTTNQELPPLPLAYERTLDPQKATYSYKRASGKISFTDEQILRRVKRARENKDWFTSPEWRKKGMPFEQIEILINNAPITIYNYSQQRPFTQEHIAETTKTLSEIASYFPHFTRKVDYILLNDIQPKSELGDNDNLPTNGKTNHEWKLIQLNPRGTDMQLPYRIPSISNFTGVLTHELGHLAMESDFKEEWDVFKRAKCSDYPEEWEYMPDSDFVLYRNKKTGEFASGDYPIDKEQCVTQYAQLSWNEDFAESLAAYIHDPELLKSVSPDKFAILQKHDAQQAKPEISIIRTPEDQIRLPEIKPETVYYFIKEPQS